MNLETLLYVQNAQIHIAMHQKSHVIRKLYGSKNREQNEQEK